MILDNVCVPIWTGKNPCLFTNGRRKLHQRVTVALLKMVLSGVFGKQQIIVLGNYLKSFRCYQVRSNVVNKFTYTLGWVSWNIHAFFFYKKHNYKKHRPTLPKTLRNIQGYSGKPKKRFMKEILVKHLKITFLCYLHWKNINIFYSNLYCTSI